MSKQREQDQPDQQDFTPEDRAAYFEKKVTYWEGKVGRLIHPPKVKRAKKRLAHYQGKLAEAQAVLAKA
jgi:hypothetical protein